MCCPGRTSVRAAHRWYSVALLLLLSAAAISTAQEVGAADDGELELTARVVGPDSRRAPVADWRFRVTPVDYPNVTFVATTDLDGRANLVLDSGVYEIRSEAPYPLGEQRFAWRMRFEVEGGDVIDLELSEGNAVNSGRASRARPAELDMVQIYRLSRDSIFQVSSGSGNGSGFLVDSSGLVLTSHHLLASSEDPTVVVSEGRGYRARVVATDAQNDVALLRVNPIVVEALEPLTLAEDDPTEPPCVVGQQILAIGSPLAAENVVVDALVSKVDERAIYSNTAVGPGSSGGPVFNMRGEVIAIQTNGPGSHEATAASASRAGRFARLHLARPLLDSVEAQRWKVASPSAGRLPLD